MFYLGLDLGKRQDYTAIAVVERRETYPGYQHSRLHSMAVRHVEGMPLGTPYVQVVERVKEIMACRTSPGTGL
jgi:phage terminase large subunit-like protein